MKKIISLILCLLMLPIAFAATTITADKIPIVQKYPTNWSTVDKGAYGEVILEYNIEMGKISYQRARAIVHGLEAQTDYTLIYYGYGAINDVWNYATCIQSAKTSTQGYFSTMSGKFQHLGFFDDNINQKFWVVKSSDVNCSANRMILWNPTQYLFETKTV